jgi:hypothetical protein
VVVEVRKTAQFSKENGGKEGEEKKGVTAKKMDGMDMLVRESL